MGQREGGEGAVTANHSLVCQHAVIRQWEAVLLLPLLILSNISTGQFRPVAAFHPYDHNLWEMIFLTAFVPYLLCMRVY